MGKNYLDGAITSNMKGALKDYIQRIEQIEENKKDLSEDLKEIYSIAKSEGFDTKIMRQVIKRRKMDRSDRDELDTLINIYEDAIEEVKEMMK